MKIGITQRLFLAIALAAGLAAISMVLTMQWSVRQGFLRYVNTLEEAGIARLAKALEEEYGRETGWGGVLRDPRLWHRLTTTAMPETDQPLPPPGPGQGPRPGWPPRGMPDGRPPDGPPLPQSHHHLMPRLFLLDADGAVLIGRDGVAGGHQTTPLFHQGKVVGSLGLLPRKELSGPYQERFLQEQAKAFAVVAGVVILLLATGLSLLLSRRLIRPLRHLAEATHRLAAGRFATRVTVAAGDELGQLADDFNTLATTLERNEQARRQWVADISHELRTPVAILRGEIEALQDGIRQPDPGSLRSLHGEVLRLGRLVDDLHQLAMSDLGALTYRKERVDLPGLLQEALASHAANFSAKDIAITTSLPPANSAAVFGDTARLRQLFANLFDNALKYTDDGGRLHVGMISHGNTVAIDFQDSAPGVPTAELERLFERLYRVETSRNRATGGAGLGLSICRNIVEAHQGTISAQSSPLGGLWLRIELPLLEQQRCR